MCIRDRDYSKYEKTPVLFSGAEKKFEIIIDGFRYIVKFQKNAEAVSYTHLCCLCYHRGSGDRAALFHCKAMQPADPRSIAVSMLFDISVVYVGVDVRKQLAADLIDVYKRQLGHRSCKGRMIMEKMDEMIQIYNRTE